MKAKQLRFFTRQDNTPKAPKTKQTKLTKPLKLEGTILSTGKLVLPQPAIDQLGIPLDSLRFQIGTQPGQRKLKVLYLVPTQDDQGESFPMKKGAKSYSIALGPILQKGGLDYSLIKYTFTLKPFIYQEGVTGYELQLLDTTPKPAYTGKPRGRKAKVTV
ncbi:hypothetical protein [Spirosoma koreense]